MLTDLTPYLTPEVTALALSPRVLFGIWCVALLSSIFRYVSWSGSLYWLFYVHQALAWRGRKIQAAFPRREQLANELRWSLVSCVVYSLMTLGLVVAALNHLTRLYLNVEDYGWGYLILSFFLMLVLHDTYFYFVHRWSHRNRYFFRHFHQIHHQTSNPTPFADIMFHPVDAVVHAGFVPIFLFCLPLHPLAFGAFMLIVMVVNALGHIGYEFFPATAAAKEGRHWVARPTGHNLHHERVQVNFGLYFTFWDRLLGTFECQANKRLGREDPSHASRSA